MKTKSGPIQHQSKTLPLTGAYQLHHLLSRFNLSYIITQAVNTLLVFCPNLADKYYSFDTLYV